MLVILGIIAAITVPSMMGVIESAKEKVCHENRLQLERSYESWLKLEGVEHSSIGFTQYLQGYDGDICPVHVEISYVYGKVWCSVHSMGQGNGENDVEGEVPYL